MLHACGRGGQRWIEGFCGGDLREIHHLEDTGVDGGILLKWMFNKLIGVMDWIDLAEDMDRWRALVNALMNLRVP